MTRYPKQRPGARSASSSAGARRPAGRAVMNRCGALCLVAMLWVWSTPGCAGSPPALTLQRWEASHPAMGTSFRIVCYARDDAHAARAAADAFARIDALDDQLSDYDSRSALSQLGARSDAGPTGPLPVGDDLLRVLQLAAELARETEGAFDPTVGPWTQVWRRARRAGVPPGDDVLEALAPSVGHQLLRVDERARTVALDARGMRLDLGGIAKGFALDEALATLARHGIERALVDGGGDVVVGAPPPGRDAWRVAIEPFAGEGGGRTVVVELAHRALATSGDTYRALEHAGLRHGHILDPRTGRALTDGTGASVLAPDGARADALASAACVLGAARALELCRELEDVELRVVARDVDGELARSTTAGFDALVVEPPGDG